MTVTDILRSYGVPDNCDPRVREIFAYWDDKRRGRRMPSRADIDPLEIPSFLPNIILVDVLDRPPHYRYRLVGTDIVEKRGYDPTGRPVAETFFGRSREEVVGNYDEIVRHRRPKYIDTPFVEPRGWYVYAERIMMPLSDDDDRVNMVFIHALWKDAHDGGEDDVLSRVS